MSSTENNVVEELEKRAWILDYALTEIIRQFDYGNDEKWVKSTRDIMIGFGESAYMRHKNNLKEKK